MLFVLIGNTSAFCGTVIKKYFPTACEEQIMIICENGRQFHGPTRLFKKIRE